VCACCSSSAPNDYNYYNYYYYYHHYSAHMAAVEAAPVVRGYAVSTKGGAVIVQYNTPVYGFAKTGQLVVSDVTAVNLINVGDATVYGNVTAVDTAQQTISVTSTPAFAGACGNTMTPLGSAVGRDAVFIDFFLEKPVDTAALTTPVYTYTGTASGLFDIASSAATEIGPFAFDSYVDAYTVRMRYDATAPGEYWTTNTLFINLPFLQLAGVTSIPQQDYNETFIYVQSRTLAALSNLDYIAVETVFNGLLLTSSNIVYNPNPLQLVHVGYTVTNYGFGVGTTTCVTAVDLEDGYATLSNTFTNAASCAPFTATALFNFPIYFQDRVVVDFDLNFNVDTNVPPSSAYMYVLNTNSNAVFGPFAFDSFPNNHTLRFAMRLPYPTNAVTTPTLYSITLYNLAVGIVMVAGLQSDAADGARPVHRILYSDLTPAQTRQRGFAFYYPNFSNVVYDTPADSSIIRGAIVAYDSADTQSLVLSSFPVISSTSASATANASAAGPAGAAASTLVNYRVTEVTVSSASGANFVSPDNPLVVDINTQFNVPLLGISEQFNLDAYEWFNTQLALPTAYISNGSVALLNGAPASVIAQQTDAHAVTLRMPAFHYAAWRNLGSQTFRYRIDYAYVWARTTVASNQLTLTYAADADLLQNGFLVVNATYLPNNTRVLSRAGLVVTLDKNAIASAPVAGATFNVYSNLATSMNSDFANGAVAVSAVACETYQLETSDGFYGTTQPVFDALAGNCIMVADLAVQLTAYNAPLLLSVAATFCSAYSVSCWVAFNQYVTINANFTNQNEIFGFGTYFSRIEALELQGYVQGGVWKLNHSWFQYDLISSVPAGVATPASLNTRPTFVANVTAASTLLTNVNSYAVGTLKVGAVLMNANLPDGTSILAVDTSDPLNVKVTISLPALSTQAAATVSMTYFHHYVVSWAASSIYAQTRRTYMDGVLVGSDTPNPTPSGIPFFTGERLTIGRRITQRSPSGMVTTFRSFDGYNRQLTDAEVAAIYAAGPYGTPPAPASCTQSDTFANYLPPDNGLARLHVNSLYKSTVTSNTNVAQSIDAQSDAFPYYYMLSNGSYQWKMYCAGSTDTAPVSFVPGADLVLRESGDTRESYARIVSVNYTAPFYVNVNAAKYSLYTFYYKIGLGRARMAQNEYSVGDPILITPNDRTPQIRGNLYRIIDLGPNMDIELDAGSFRTVTEVLPATSPRTYVLQFDAGTDLAFATNPCYPLDVALDSRITTFTADITAGSLTLNNVSGAAVAGDFLSHPALANDVTVYARYTCGAATCLALYSESAATVTAAVINNLHPVLAVTRAVDAANFQVTVQLQSAADTLDTGAQTGRAFPNLSTLAAVVDVARYNAPGATSYDFGRSHRGGEFWTVPALTGFMNALPQATFEDGRHQTVAAAKIQFDRTYLNATHVADLIYDIAPANTPAPALDYAVEGNDLLLTPDAPGAEPVFATVVSLTRGTALSTLLGTQRVLLPPYGYNYLLSWTSGAGAVPTFDALAGTAVMTSPRAPAIETPGVPGFNSTALALNVAYTAACWIAFSNYSSAYASNPVFGFGTDGYNQALGVGGTVVGATWQIYGLWFNNDLTADVPAAVATAAQLNTHPTFTCNITSGSRILHNCSAAAPATLVVGAVVVSSSANVIPAGASVLAIDDSDPLDVKVEISLTPTASIAGATVALTYLHHYVFSWSLASGERKIYFDGTLCGSDIRTDPPAFSGELFYIGRYTNATVAAGTVTVARSLCLWNYQMTDSEVASLYAAGHSAACPNNNSLRVQLKNPSDSLSAGPGTVTANASELVSQILLVDRFGNDQVVQTYGGSAANAATDSMTLNYTPPCGLLYIEPPLAGAP